MYLLYLINQNGLSDRDMCVGEVVLFLKSEQEFDRQYQYGIFVIAILRRDGLIRIVEYQNTSRTTRDRLYGESEM